jgi:hypothetical protein
MVPFSPKLFNKEHTRRLAGSLLLGIDNHLNNVAGLHFCLLNRCFVAEQLSSVEPSLGENVDIFLRLETKKEFIGIISKVL